MAFSLTTLRQQVKLVLRGVSMGKLVTMAILVGGTISGIIFILTWSGTEDFHPLYSNLAPEDAAEVVTKLKKEHIPYKSTKDGKGILIPYEKINETRLQLASEGLPRWAGIGFEVFDDVKMGMTEFVQNVNYQRALQGELSRTINTLTEVESSRVHIAMPSKTLFIDEEEPSTASVILKLRSGRYLNKEQIQGIVYLISSSVSRLKPENITIVDDTGKMLAGMKEENGVNQTMSNQLAFQEKKERLLENRVKTMLESVLGLDKAIVRVSCLLNFTQQEKTEELYHPEKSVLRSEQSSISIANEAGSISGIPGLQSNVVPTKAGTSEQKTEINNRKQQSMINYGVGKFANRQIMPVGSIERLSVAVVIDGTYDPPEDGAESDQPVYVPRTALEMAKLENIVKSIVDYNESRGDKIEVVNIPFHVDAALKLKEETTAATWMEMLQKHQMIIKYGAATLFILLSYFIAVKPLAKWLTSTPIEEIQMVEKLPKTIKELERRYALVEDEKSYAGQLKNLIVDNTAGSTKLMKKWIQEA